MKKLGFLLKALKIFTVMSGKKRIIALVGLIISFITMKIPALGNALGETFTPELVEQFVDWVGGGSVFIGAIGIAHAQYKESKAKKETTE